jgi:RND family efflux transporter MFP subunit
MIGKCVLPLLAAIGVTVAISTVIQGNENPPALPPVIQPTKAPFASYVAGAGMVETSTENIAIGTPVSGIVTYVLVKWGDSVKAGDTLFQIDDRDLRAQLLPAIAKVKEADANLAKARDHLERRERLYQSSKDAISIEDLYTGRFDAAIDEAAVAAAQAEVGRLKLEIERYSITAPVAARILQIKIHPGEFATSGVLSPPLMLLGDDTRLHVRVEIDENLAWRFDATAPATAFERGNPESSVELQHLARLAHKVHLLRVVPRLLHDWMIESKTQPLVVAVGSSVDRLKVRHALVACNS